MQSGAYLIGTPPLSFSCLQLVQIQPRSCIGVTDSIHPGAKNVGYRTRRRGQREIEGGGEPFLSRRDRIAVATVAAGMFLMMFLIMSGPAQRQAAGRLAQDPSLRLIGGPQPENCLVERDTRKVIGPIYAVLARDGHAVMYRVRPMRRGTGPKNPPSLGFPYDVPIASVRVVPCVRVGMRTHYEG